MHFSGKFILLTNGLTLKQVIKAYAKRNSKRQF